MTTLPSPLNKTRLYLLYKNGYFIPKDVKYSPLQQAIKASLYTKTQHLQQVEFERPLLSVVDDKFEGLMHKLTIMMLKEHLMKIVKRVG